MSRIRNAWLALIGEDQGDDRVESQAAADSVTTDTGSGPLFGLSPPDGHQFHVSLSSSGFWHVQIHKGDRYVTGGCERAGNDSDEAVIAAAARGALDRYARQIERERRKAKFEGIYPPKRIEASE